MQSIIKEIIKLRSGKPIVIDYHNSNRYRLVVMESNATKTAYCFSTPIYNKETRKLVDMKFRTNEDKIYAIGSNANITLSSQILMKNADGGVKIELPQKAILFSEQEAQSGSWIFSPTTNGIAIKFDAKNLTDNCFTIETTQLYLSVRANDRCLAVMKEKFRPLIIISSVGVLDVSGNIVAPVKLEYTKLTDNKYKITFSTTCSLAHSILLEVNMYENKLFQDTTVESSNPSVNNAFGGVGFIGNSLEYGEQWLYSRLDYSRISEVMNECVNKVVLHIPKLNESNVETNAYKIEARFCSFGSTWNNKVSGSKHVSNSQMRHGYQNLDITYLLVDPQTKTISNSEGFILKSQIKGSGFSVLSTGDSCYAPQILEINYL